MTLLILGILLWSVVHFIPSLAQPLKGGWKNKLGENGYKATFALLIFVSLLMIIFGWRSAVPSAVYVPAYELRPLAFILMIAAFILFIAAQQSTRIKQFIRHPQLTSLIVWSVAHLLVNGDSRSVVLFGGLGLWAIIEIIAINRRDGTWVKAAVPTWAGELKVVAIGLIVFVAIIFAHPYLSGIPLR